MARQWFADADETDQSLDRAMVEQLRRDVGPRISALRSLVNGTDAAQATGELHKLRGAIGSFGFSASAEHLKRLELGWTRLPAEVRLTELGDAETTFQKGLVELVKQFPHLA